MKRKHHDDSSDALDTFLDTVCNLFGIIIFLAMMIVILASTTSQEITDERASQISDLEQDLLAGLEERHDELDDRLDAYLQHDGLAETRILDEIELNTAEAREEIDRRKAIIAAYDARIAGGSEELRTLADSLETLQQEVEELKQQNAAADQLSNRKLRTPRVTQVDTWPVTLIIVNGRLYEPNDWQGRIKRGVLEPGDWCLAMKSWRAADVDINQSSVTGDCYRSGASSLDRTIQLKEGGGIPISMDRPLNTNPAWLALKQRYKPKLQHVIIWVAPNSFAEFGLVRAALAEQGFRYNIRHASPTFSDTLLHKDGFIAGQPEAQ